MEAPRNGLKKNQYRAGRLIISAPGHLLNQLEIQSSTLAEMTGTALKLVATATARPRLYRHNGTAWQETAPEAGPDSAVAYTSFGQGSTSENAIRFYEAPASEAPDTPGLAQQLKKTLNRPNPLGITGFDISLDHVVKITGPGGFNETGNSPFDIPARSFPKNGPGESARAAFRTQACWKTIGAADRPNFAARGEGVTVVILDSAPDLKRVNPALVDTFISMPGIVDQAGLTDEKDKELSLSEIYSLSPVMPPPYQRPGDKDITPSLLEPYHGLLSASLVRELAPAARIILLEVLNEQGETSGSSLVEAMDYVLGLQKSGAAIEGQPIISEKLVINLSLGIARSLSEEAEALYLLHACERACGQGAVIVAAAGNDSYYLHPRNPEEPAAYGYFCDTRPTYEQVIAVAATGPAPGEYALYSNQGNLAAPGMDLLMDTGDARNPARSRYVYWTGTSFAAPLASGSVATLLSAGATAGQVKQLLWEGASAPRYWHGVAEINLSGSLQLLARHKNQPA